MTPSVAHVTAVCTSSHQRALWCGGITFAAAVVCSTRRYTTAHQSGQHAREARMPNTGTTMVHLAVEESVLAGHLVCVHTDVRTFSVCRLHLLSTQTEIIPNGFNVSTDESRNGNRNRENEDAYNMVVRITHRLISLNSCALVCRPGVSSPRENEDFATPLLAATVK